MTLSTLSPGLILVLGGLLLPLLRGRGRDLAVLALPLVTLAAVWAVPEGTAGIVDFLGLAIEPVRGSTLGRLFATVFSIMAFAGGLYAVRHARTLELAAALVYAGSAIGVTFAGDLFTLFIFWEIMAVGSTVVIWAADTDRAYRASIRYLLVHLFGGVVLMFGIAAYVAETGSVTFELMQLEGIGTWLILAGFLVNAGAPPLSAWIADAYPEASPSGTVFLSAFTTKTAVYALLVGFAGSAILIPIGLYMIFYGIVYALLENDMRRILAYSIVNQVGFMVTGIGVGTTMAMNGVAAHAFAHIIYKGLLFMAAGGVLLRTGRRLCTDLGGLFRTMPLTTLFGTIGAISISSFPFTSGFVSKSMISQAAADEHLAIAWFLLTAASAGVFLHAGIKFPWFVFFQKDSGLRPPESPGNMKVAMALFSFLCIFLGVFPAPLYAILPFPVEYVPYTVAHLVSQFQLLLFAGLAFFVMLPMMKRTTTLTLDWDWGYRHLAPRVVHWIGHVGSAAWSSFAAGPRQRYDAVVGGLFRAHGPHGPLARSWPIGSMVFWVAIMLLAYLLLALL
ncbi:MAG: Na(+)/H(+) antiporter subunit D [Gemmatimonadota bacterium]